VVQIERHHIAPGPPGYAHAQGKSIWHSRIYTDFYQAAPWEVRFLPDLYIYLLPFGINILYFCTAGSELIDIQVIARSAVVQGGYGSKKSGQIGRATGTGEPVGSPGIFSAFQRVGIEIVVAGEG
jgi:hypothetical protein